MKEIAPEELRRLVSYDPDTGALHRTEDGSPITTTDEFGYIRFRVGGVRMRGHRAAWVIHYGSWPEGTVDHINSDRADNRLSNLRLASIAENVRNGRARRAGLKGATKLKNGKWRAQIMVNRRNIYLGDHATEEAAAAAYDRAARRHHGEFARTNGEV